MQKAGIRTFIFSARMPTRKPDFLLRRLTLYSLVVSTEWHTKKQTGLRINVNKNFISNIRITNVILHLKIILLLLKNVSPQISQLVVGLL
jgi:hypothetical protein